MDYTSLAAYVAALAALTAAPGPLMAVLVARTLAQDARGAIAFATGLCLGDVLAAAAILSAPRASPTSRRNGWAC